MPSTQFFPVSGGITLVSGNIFSGTGVPLGGLNLRLSSSGAGPIFVGLPNLSGELTVMMSGGSMSSGGMADAIELAPGNTYFIPKSRLQASGIQSVRLVGPAASSGARLFWDWQ